jgi:hypothetical protein
MNNEIKKDETYKCQICNKETKNSVDAVTHYIDHASGAMGAINDLIKDQRTGNVSTGDRARISAADKTNVQKDKAIVAVQEV